MMPIAGTPIIIHLMRTFAAQGFRDFVLAAGHRKEVLSDYFEGRFPEWNVQVVDTGAGSDTGERIQRCSPYVGERFMATYGDGLGNVDLGQLLEFHRMSGGLGTVTTVPLRSQYGTVDFDGLGRVENFREKPTIRDYWINAGFFVFNRGVFDVWRGRNLEVEVLPGLAAQGQLFAYRHEGFWKSLDTSKDQQEMETIYGAGSPPWMRIPGVQTAARAVSNGQ
jgi:glucose-1-phosphate cytidylyltransferase